MTGRAQASAAAWAPHLRAGEQVVWEGSPAPRLRLTRRETVQGGAALVAAAASASATRYQPEDALFWGLLAVFFVGFAVLPPLRRTLARRNIGYALTDRGRAFVRRGATVEAHELPRGAEPRLSEDLRDVVFAQTTIRHKGRERSWPVGFFDIDDAPEAATLIRTLAGAAP